MKPKDCNKMPKAARQDWLTKVFQDDKDNGDEEVGERNKAKTFNTCFNIESLNIFLVHPFLLAIVPYILMANCNVKDVYSRPEYLILIYGLVFLTVYLYRKLKGYISLKKIQ